MKNTTSKFIVFEGIDRSGKTTQMRSLHQYLNKTTTLSVWATREPFDESVRYRLKNSNLDPVTQLELLIRDRTEHCKLIKEKMGEFDVILCDRFTDSTLAYQGYGHGFGLDLIRELNEIATDGLTPDVVFLFDCPANVAFKRLENKPLDNIEKDIFFLERVRWGYLEIARQKKYHLIDSSQSVGSVSNQVVLAVVDCL